MPTGSLSRGGFSPAEIARAYRDEHPKMFDDLADADLIHAIQQEDPDTYALIDPLLEGAEILGQPSAVPPPGQPKIPTRPITPTTFDTLATTGLRLVPPLLAGGVAAYTSGGLAVPAATAAGAGLGETGAQYYEKTFGPREAINPYVIAAESALGALNPAARGSSMLARTGSQVGYGALLGAGGQTTRTLLEEGRLPTGGEAGTAALYGGLLGGTIHAGFEGAGAVARRAPEFGDATGALPIDGGPPPASIDQLAMARASAAQYQAEEQRLLQGLTRIYGPDARPSRAVDLHTATQARDYLEQLAALNRPPIAIPPIQTGLTPADVLAPPPQGQLPAGRGDPNAFRAYPPGENPNLELVGSGAPPANRIIGGRDVGAGGPPPSLESALESSLSAPPGPGRLVPPLELTSPDSAIPRGTPGQPPLLTLPTRAQLRSSFGRAERQRGEIGGAPPTREEPHLPGITTPGQDRPYTQGPNAGPRREQELHGRPRTVRRQIQVGSKTKYEFPDSVLPAEDPGTYPPEVRRELAAMAWELEHFQHERVQGGITQAMIQDVMDRDNVDVATAIATLKKSGATAGGAIAGAPVYHDIIEAAQGSFPHVKRADMLKHVRAALLEGKGTGLSDAAAQVARQRLAERSAGKLARTSTILAQRGDEGDALIGWVDDQGRAALPDQDLDEFQRAARDATDGEILGMVRMWREHGPEGLNPDTHGQFEAAVGEAEHRGLIDREQLPLTMEGPGGDKGPSLFDFEGGETAGGPPKPPADLAQSRAPARKAALESLATDEAMGTEFPEDEPSHFPNGEEAVVCTNCARRIIELNGGKGEIYGWEEGTNPTSVIAGPTHGAQIDTGQGHDFAVIDGRYLVDAWAKTVEGSADRAVFDLDDPADVAEVRRLFGDPTTWLRASKDPLGDDLGFKPGAPRQLQADTPLPGMAGVRSESRAMPEVADLPFSLTAPPPKPLGTRKGADLPGLFDRLKGEEGVLILDIPAGDRTGLKKWLKKNEDEHGGEPWFSRVEQHIEDGEWDRAWKAAAGASVRSYARAYQEARTPGAQQALSQAIKGTPLQADINTEIVAGARKRAGVGDAPPVQDFPPSRRATQAGAARGKATIGPAGILNPGPRQRPLSSAAPALRAATLDLSVVRLIKEGIEEVEGLATVPGNTDTFIRLYRQIGDQIYKGQNLKLLRDAGVKIPPEELAQHWNATISDAGRTLQLMSSFAQAHKEVLTEAAERMSMGGALRGILGEKGAPPVYTGARGRVSSPAGQRATQEVIDQIAERTSQYQANAMANDLQKRQTIGTARALHDASYSWMLSKWNTAVRNYVSMAGRYTVDSLDHALTIPIAQLTGDEPTATLSTALLKERGLQPMGRRGTAVTPKAAWADDLQGIYDFTTDNLNALKPNDARRAIRLLLDQPEQMTHFLGSMAGEDLQAQFSNTPVIRHLVNPKVQRVLTMFNRAQEFSARATVFDATTRALLRAKGLDPTDLLQKPTAEIIQAVGGQQAFDDLMFTATAQSLEATFAGRTSKDSLPGILIRGINEWWPAKLGIPFPRFNLSAAPRWIFDHSPAALVDLVRFPLDRAGITASKGSVAGGRLYRGVRAQEIVRDELPALQLKIGQAEKAQGTALQELLGTQREFAIRQRQVTRLGKRQGRPLPATGDPLGEATAALEQLGKRRTQLKAAVAEQKGVVTDLKSEQKKLLNRVADATGINAPNYSQFLARMTTGTVGMLGAAWVVRAQDGAQGTRWYEYRVDREGKDPIVLDFRPFAPFAQYLFVADVMNDFYQHTDWDKVKADAYQDPEEGTLASPLEWSRAMWQNYEGKYTEAELGSQFAQAFLSISRAAGTTLTLTDLMTQNGWPSLEDAARATVGTIGQFLSRFTVPGQQISDIAAHFDPEEAKVRTPPKATFEDWERPLAGPLSNVPGVRQLIPERLSQTTGQPVAAEYPLLRALAGIGTAPRDFVTEEVRRIGVPGQSVFIRETGDYGLDRMIAESYSKVLAEELPGILEDPSYTELATPARQRDFLQRYIFPALKRAALADAREGMGDARFEGAMVRGENARRKARQEALIGELEAEEPAVQEDQPDQDQTATPPPPPPF